MILAIYRPFSFIGINQFYKVSEQIVSQLYYFYFCFSPHLS